MQSTGHAASGDVGPPFSSGQVPGRPAQYDSIQYLRGIAAVLVLIAHSLEHPQPESLSPLLKTGRIGVQIFFVISGFIITVICGNYRFDPLEFARRRFFRVVPVYQFYTIVVAVLTLTLPWVFKTTTFDLSYFVHSMLFIPYPDPVAPHTYQPLFKLGWTLEYELFFYLCMGSLFFLDGKRRTLVMIAVFGLFVILGQTLFSEPSVINFYASLRLLPFLCGIVLGYLALMGRLHSLPKAAYMAVHACTLIAIAVFCLLTWRQVCTPPGKIMMSISSALVVLSGLLIENSGRLIKSRALKLTGDATYSIYLAHMFLVAAVWAVSKRLFHPAAFDAIYVATAFLAMAAGLIAGLVSYQVIERPVIKLGHGRKRMTVPAT